MGDTDYVLLIQSPDATTVLVDPIGPADAAGSPGWRSINLSPRFNEVGTGSFTAAANLDLMNAVTTPEARVVVIREPDGESAVIEMAGPIENVQLNRDVERDGVDGVGRITVTFVDDLAALATRLVYPNPAQAATSQTTATRYTITAVNAEDAARALVNLNAGPGALTGRKFPELALGTDHGVGTSVSATFTRSVVLTDALRYVLFIGGNLGMRTYQDTAGVVRFEVYAPRDLSATVWFSQDLGNIRSIDYEFASPTGTVAIVGDAAAGTGRVIKERSNSTALADGWRRKEMFVDGRSAANATELEKTGDKALQDAAPASRVSVVAIETPAQRYRTDFGIGDTVSVEVFEGKVIEDVIRGVDIVVTPEQGEVISPLIGADRDAAIDLKTAEIDKLKKRLAQLEDAAGIVE